MVTAKGRGRARDGAQPTPTQESRSASLSPGRDGGSNLAAAKSGDRRAALEQLRDTLAGLLDTTDAQVHAQLAAQYRATLADLAALSPGAAKGGVDELKKRRQAKGGRPAAHASGNA